MTKIAIRKVATIVCPIFGILSLVSTGIWWALGFSVAGCILGWILKEQNLLERLGFRLSVIAFAVVLVRIFVGVFIFGPASLF